MIIATTRTRDEHLSCSLYLLMDVTIFLRNLFHSGQRLLVLFLISHWTFTYHTWLKHKSDVQSSKMIKNTGILRCIAHQIFYKLIQWNEEIQKGNLRANNLFSLGQFLDSRSQGVDHVTSVQLPGNSSDARLMSFTLRDLNQLISLWMFDGKSNFTIQLTRIHETTVLQLEAESRKKYKCQRKLYRKMLHILDTRNLHHQQQICPWLFCYCCTISLQQWKTLKSSIKSSCSSQIQPTLCS